MILFDDIQSNWSYIYHHNINWIVQDEQYSTSPGTLHYVFALSESILYSDMEGIRRKFLHTRGGRLVSNSGRLSAKMMIMMTRITPRLFPIDPGRQKRKQKDK